MFPTLLCMMCILISRLWHPLLLNSSIKIVLASFLTYTRPRKPYNPDHHLIAPLTTSFFLFLFSKVMFLSSHDIPQDWSVHIHPSGPCYYICESHTLANTSSMLSMPYVPLPFQVITDADIVNPEEWQLLLEFLDNIITYIGLSFGWMPLMLGNCQFGVTGTEPSHLAYAIGFQYWCQEMTSDMIEEAKDLLINCLAELQQYLSIITSIISKKEILQAAMGYIINQVQYVL
ncbi:hypothetical protein IW262DRAFT_1300796 [Armillaria fumosa]|nr:hypothetical protein IW262DRAFT_1300796 [Armillaria fumosa]